MQNAQLVSHVDTDIVTRAELQAPPTPDATQKLDRHVGGAEPQGSTAVYRVSP
jgi:hypothetical protein